MLLTMLMASFAVGAQSWRVYSPAEKSFSIKLPVPLQRVTSFEGKYGASTELGHDVHKNVLSYTALQSAPKVREYGVIVIDGKSKEFLSAKRIDGFEFFIGGDDATPTSQRTVHVNGMTGKEYVYANKSMCMLRR